LNGKYGNINANLLKKEGEPISTLYSPYYWGTSNGTTEYIQEFGFDEQS